MLVWEPGDELAPVVACIERGGILAIPTESTYGLGADPCSARGCKAILEVKGRAASKALPIVVPDLETAFALGVSRHTPGLAATAAHWPAALSIVADLERPLAAAGGGDTIALRIPDHPGLLGLLGDLGRALTATSANRSGEPPVVRVEELAELLGGADACIIGGARLPGGAPSTLVRWAAEGPVLLR